MFILKNADKFYLTTNLFSDDQEEFISLAKKHNEKVFAIEGADGKTKIDGSISLHELSIIDDKYFVFKRGNKIKKLALREL